ncbi:diguanylate cyclase [Deinococcus sp. KSM4-11]|uniref:sensor domain-containing diguanylate cyclase/phosphohydrolase n=1 Tax=Deinococcus sp. KSM4-11 TaxID=2568654 RepID=UPI0010A5671C|nr:HD domain-containing phosphohydrolase [Deinococcus sp. KSM4-11]THF87172.1 diguanylate cyclase [Deinococcus sp. KSM4-11]
MNEAEHHFEFFLPVPHWLRDFVNDEVARITRIAAQLFKVQRAHISLSDPITQGFDRAVDAAPLMRPQGLPLAMPFEAGAQPSFLEVPDLALHADASTLPLIDGSATVRYYAEVRLMTDTGAALGTLTLIDGAPRAPMTPDQQAVLRDVAGMAVDVLQRYRTQATHTAEVQQMAYEDHLTRLPNRRAFEGHFEHDVTTGTEFGLVLLDLDELKRVNDEDGHGEGDRLLSSFAQALQDEFCAYGRVYRWGGDEFVVLLTGHQLSLHEVRTKVDDIEQRLVKAGLPGTLASLGMVEYPLDALAPNDLMRLVDQRMLREKTARRAARGLRTQTPNSQATPWAGEMLWQVLRATAALITADDVMGQAGWQAFLEAAVAALPGAEAGSLYVIDDKLFVMQAQVGYSAALLGAGRTPATMQQWHGTAEGWRHGEARMLRGSAAIQARRYEYDRAPELSAALMDDLCAIQLIQANLLVPVMVRGRVVAALNLDNLRSAQAFEPYEVEMAEEFARQAAAILAAHERRGREAARTQELEVMAHATEALAGVHTAEDIELLLVAESVALLRTEHAVYARHDPDGLRLVAPSGIYAHSSLHQIPPGQGLAWHALQIQQVIHVPTISDDARVYWGTDLIDGALILAPLLSAAGTPLGVLAAVRAAPQSFSDLDSRLLRALASAGATALERLQVTAQERRRSQEFQMLATLSEKLGLGDDTRAVAEECLAACRSFLDADFAVFLRPDRPLVVTQGTRPVAFIGLPPEWLAARVHELRAGGKAATYCATHNYRATDSPHAPLVDAGVHALVSVPVLERGQPVGLVALLWLRPLSALPESAVPLLTRSAELIEQVMDREAHIADLTATREGALLALGRSLELRDFETAGHTERVVALALNIAERLGVDEGVLADLRVGAYLHDIGKLAVPDAILLKPGKLDPGEWATMQRHTTIGDELVARIPTVTARARSVVRSHHERWDGTGYPDGLAAEGIPEGARIFSVADVYDALTSARPYKAAWTPEEALSELVAQTGRQFDPEVVRAAVEVLTLPPMEG